MSTSLSPSTSKEENTSSCEEKSVGCSHYKRKCKFVTPCCDKVYTCRFCHDEAEDHTLNRKAIKELICLMCESRQSIRVECEKCNTRFGQYTCLKCNLFDDEDRKQFHCEGCGICRIGGADKFFHCLTCNMCLPLSMQSSHKCVENVSHGNCPVCLEYLLTSRLPCHIPPCGHLIHRVCFEQLVKSGLYTCPLCQTCLMNMAEVWVLLDNEIANTPMPEEYKYHIIKILCKDCHKHSIVKFHVIGSKCGHCGSYNTCNVKGPYNARELVKGSDGPDEGNSSGGSSGANESMPSSSC